MDAKLEHGRLVIDTESLIRDLPLNAKRELVAAVFADEEFIARVVDVLECGITTEDVGSLYDRTLEALQARLAEKWPEMARELIRALVYRVRRAEEERQHLSDHINDWVSYYRDPQRRNMPERTPSISLDAHLTGAKALDAEIDRIIAATEAAEDSAK